ncbi:hypothetical protein KDA_73140 [Dictyobacter alpinus]|uniref:Shikimate kinase n=1 Tax=Dictyobacter alpinus TaxID=2014873 RepID=A0A402BKJ0_9CHLR|nr:hypothetical protein [Dictyobacter alpinus]GCE31830.1 hypothetical protein KDA_73140 [Dictyobacter alpinus]
MLKIHLIGGPGSGKTTLGAQLGERFNIPHYDLDQIGWKHGMGPLSLYVREALTILKQPGWVTEGNYLFWTDPLLHEADCIVLLDIPLALALWRVLYRHVDKSLRGTNPYATKLMIPLLKDMPRFYDHTNRPPTEFMRKYLDLYRAQTRVPTTGFDEEFAAHYLVTYQTISEPPTAEFSQHYHESYPAGVEPPALDFLRMYHDKFRMSELTNTIATMYQYLEYYAGKVFVLKNKTDRQRLLAHLDQLDQKQSD